MYTVPLVACIIIIVCFLPRIYGFFCYKNYRYYSCRIKFTIESIKLYYFTWNETYLEYLAYDRYQYQLGYRQNFWCGVNNDDPYKYGCDCPRKILRCGCTICENVMRDGRFRPIPTYSGIDYFGCPQCFKGRCTPNLMWNYDPNRGKQLKRYIVDRYISNIENELNMKIPSDINGVITDYYGMDNRRIGC